MKKFLEKYLLCLIIIGISFISICASLVILKGDKLNLFKNRMGATVVDAVPTGSTITDVEFYAELVDSYNAEKGTTYSYDHVFTSEELASLLTLSIDENGPNYHGGHVANLSGLAYLTGLKNLYLKNISATSIDLTHNTALESLVLYDNGITSLDLSKNAAITTIDINIPTLTKMVLIDNDNLASLNTNKPTSAGYLMVDLGRSVSYIVGGSGNQGESIKDNSFGITCGKYNLAINESTTCYVKGNTSEQMNAVIFKLLKDNENISITDITNVAELSGNLEYQLYGSVPLGEFNILSFTVTGVSAGSSKIYLDNYDEVPKGYVDTVTYDYVPVTDEISKMIYVDKFSVTDSAGTVVTTGNLKTNYLLKIVNGLGEYETAYNVGVLGDVKADGTIDIRDVAKAYDGLANGNYTAYTEVEKLALDKNNDGLKTILDLIKIYDSIQR